MRGYPDFGPRSMDIDRSMEHFIFIKNMLISRNTLKKFREIQAEARSLRNEILPDLFRNESIGIMQGLKARLDRLKQDAQVALDFIQGLESGMVDEKIQNIRKAIDLIVGSSIMSEVEANPEENESSLYHYRTIGEDIDLIDYFNELIEYIKTDVDQVFRGRLDYLKLSVDRFKDDYFKMAYIKSEKQIKSQIAYLDDMIEQIEATIDIYYSIGTTGSHDGGGL